MLSIRWQTIPPATDSPVRLFSALLPIALITSGLLVSAAAGASKRADAAPDRAMEFVERSVEATELYNQRKLPEALAAFQMLLQTYGDLDEDGYVATSLADCLYLLERYDEARTAYESVLATHPDLETVVRPRLRELALMGEPDDFLLDELRAAAAAETEHAYGIRVQLGRALQKRAAALLTESMEAFQSAVGTEPHLTQPTRRRIASHAEMLAEIQEDLRSLIERIERSWGAMKMFVELAECKEELNGQRIQGFQAAWVTGAEGLEPVRLKMSIDDGGRVQATADKQTVPLNSTQSLIIRRHQERINAILLEAMQAESAGQNPEKP